MSVYNNEGWKWALRMFHNPSRRETRVHFQLAQDQRCEPGKTLLLKFQSTIDAEIWTPKLTYYFLKNALKVQWKFCITGETSIMAKTKIHETNPTKKKKNLLTAIFKRTRGIYTHIDDVVSRDTHGICEWALLLLRVTLWHRRNMRRWAVIIVC